MVETLDRPTTGETDRFIDWMYQLTGMLVEEVGITEAKASRAVDTLVNAIQSEYGATRVYIHSAAANSQRESRTKQAQVLQWWGKGFTIQKIALRLGCTEVSVKRIITAHASPSRGRGNGAT
jgi:putative heme degradation protein